MDLSIVTRIASSSPAANPVCSQRFKLGGKATTNETAPPTGNGDKGPREEEGTHVLHVVYVKPLTARPQEDRALFLSERFLMDGG